MLSATTRRRLALGIGIAVLAIQLASGGQLSSAKEPEDVLIVRVVDRRDEMVPHSVSPVRHASADEEAQMTVTRGTIPLPAGEILSTGEAIQVIYANGTAIHEQLSSSCTVSATANSPYKSEGANYSRAVAKLSYSRSSGCSKGGATAMLVGPDLLQGTTTVASQYLNIYGGFTASVQLLKDCRTGYNKTWKSQMGAPAIAASAWVTLPCGL